MLLTCLRCPSLWPCMSKLEGDGRRSWLTSTARDEVVRGRVRGPADSHNDVEDPVAFLPVVLGARNACPSVDVAQIDHAVRWD